MSRRYLVVRPVGKIAVGFGFCVGLGVFATTKYPGAELVMLALVVAFVVDGWTAYAAVERPEVHLTALDAGDVGDEIRLVVALRHTGRPIVIVPAGNPSFDRFILPAPGSGVLRLWLSTPGRFTAQDLDVIGTGPFGLVSVARRLRVELGAPQAVGPPSFPHLYPPAPVRPVFVGPSPGSPKGTELTRGVRPYLPGDHRRSVHWNATAHTGSLMVREREGSGAIRVRVVLAILRPGPAAVIASGRANAFIREHVGQGCEVELLTLQDSNRILTDLSKPFTPAPRQRGVPPFKTVEGMIVDERQIRERLCVVVVGLPDFRSAKIPTRIISDVGDQWV